MNAEQIKRAILSSAAYVERLDSEVIARAPATTTSDIQRKLDPANAFLGNLAGRLGIDDPELGKTLLDFIEEQPAVSAANIADTSKP